ncbi:MAG: septum formation initiator family protein [Planctomycetota bacterium]|nr:septum formation initiator family protein [Planctomycetota bacterium]MDA1250556.1 septum formation initiator family protein [Planctomycetota bacterium]
MKISQPPRRAARSDDHSALEWVVSLLFWGQMIAAASLYGVVALAPKLTVFVELQNDHLRTQTQLVSLENHIHELEKVVVALQDDPRVIEELARLDLDASRPDETRIPLEGGETLQSRLGQTMHVPDVGRAWYQPLLQAFAENTSLRVTSLGVAAALVVISFTFFHPSQARSFHSGWRNLRAAFAACAARYRGRSAR